MNKYIDADKLIAEIERQQRNLTVLSSTEQVDIRRDCALQNGVYTYILGLITSLQREWNNGDGKMEWSEEDERNLYNTIEAIKYTFDVSEGSGGSCLIAWLKFHLRPQSHWKPNKDQMEALKETADRQRYSNPQLFSLYEDLLKKL